MNNQTFMIYRMIGGQRVPYHLELDATMTVVADLPVSMMTSPKATAPVVADSPDIEAIKAAAEKRAQEMLAEHHRQTEHMRAQLKTQLSGAVIPPNSPLANDPTVTGAAPTPNRVVITPTPSDIKLGEWATDLVVENPIPGTDDLRREFFAEMQDLTERHEKNATVCKPCEKGAIIRKYKDKLIAGGFLLLSK